MSVKAIREYHGKAMIFKNLGDTYRGCLIGPSFWAKDPTQGWSDLTKANPWLLTEGLVVKPDQLIKRRGKAGLIKVNVKFDEVKAWILERVHKEKDVEGVTGTLTHFLIEPFVAHKQEDEYYVCIQSHRYYDEILFYHEGGVDIGDVDSKAERMAIGTVDSSPSCEAITKALLQKVPVARQKIVGDYCQKLYQLYRDLHYCYLEINPLVVTPDNTIIALDLAAKLDETAAFLVEKKWGEVDFPTPFGRIEYPEEEHIRKLDEKTGASLKLTVLNPAGRVWLMVAGGGASVVYADTVVDFGYGDELANYGEYSGAPTGEETFQYAKTLFTLMFKNKPRKDGNVFIVGGGIANFTDVSATFGGLIKAINSYQDELKEHKVSFWVRRAGLNFLEGLRKIKTAVKALDIPIKVYGPETHMTAVIPMALGLMDVLAEPDLDAAEYLKIGGGGGGRMTNMLAHKNARHADSPTGSGKQNGHGDGHDQNFPVSKQPTKCGDPNAVEKHPHMHYPERNLQTLSSYQADENTTCLVYNLQQQAVQRMLDFDGICGRKTPSVSAVVFPFGGRSNMKVYWGVEEIFIPVYPSIRGALEAHPDITVMINFASFRSSYDSSMEALQYRQLKAIAIIAEGMPERQTREILQTAESRGISVIGPATVGGIKPGCFRIGNTGGAIENIIMSKLYRPGSVAYVSRSGGMSNELNNIICRNTDGVHEGVAVGGDRYPGTRFLDHILRYQADKDVKMIVLLGEVGGVDEYEVLDAIKDGRITKPLIAWCVGTCAAAFGEEMQFGHAGAQSRGNKETAKSKNAALASCAPQVSVPASFDGLGMEIQRVYLQLVTEGVIKPFDEPEVPTVPKDFKTLQKLGVVRPNPANIVCSISDDRGDEVTYCGVKLSHIIENGGTIGSALSLLWFKRNLPLECTKFLEMILVICADHGPAVSGAHNAIVCARAGKDVVDSLCSGLLTIGPRFGGALDNAAKSFTKAFDKGMSAKEYVDTMKKNNELIMGIGHRIKSKHNPDKRVELLKNYALKHWSCDDPQKSVLGFALGVEETTIKKKANLILNVDGCIAAAFVDMIRNCGAFTREDADQMIDAGCLNGLFVLARSIGLIGHILDQKRLNQPLYRHPFNDIAYIEDKQPDMRGGNLTPNLL